MSRSSGNKIAASFWHCCGMTTPSRTLRLASARRALADGEAVRLRQAAGLSRPEIANACGVAASTIWRWESGSRLPQGEPGVRYARLLDQLRKAEQQYASAGR